MKFIAKIIWSIVFIVVFFVASKNMETKATLNFFAGYGLTGPLPLMLLGFIVIGFILGVLAMTPSFFRHRRDLAKQKKAINKMQKDSEAHQLVRSQPPAPDTIVGA